MRPDLRILRWSYHFIYWSQNFLLLKTVDMSKHIITATCKRYHFLLFCLYEHFITYIKGKAVPLQAWTGPEGSRRLRLPEFMTIDI
jgi:hypothetical protein